MHLRPTLGLLLASFLAMTSTAQTTVTWSGLGPVSESYTSFDSPANWVGGVVPAPGDHLVFGPAPAPFIQLETSRTVGNITFSNIQNPYYFFGQSAVSLTLNGNVNTTPGSNYWGLFNLTVDLPAGNHIYTLGGADIYHFGAISGAGGITTNGPNNLILAATSTYSGGTVINAGTLYAGADSALGTGTITINGGALATSYTDNLNAGVYLPNNFLLGPNPIFGSYASDSLPISMGESDIGNTIKPITGVTTVNLSLLGKDALYIDGAIQDGAAATTYTFANDSTNSGYFLTGTNTYTGGTVVVSGSSVTFFVAGAIPTSGLITVQTGAYAGLGTATVTPATFLSRFSPTGSAGTIGFEYNTYAGAVDLSGFSDLDLSIGTTTEATLTGAITPVTGSGAYNFRGSGRLRLVDETSPNPLSGANDLVARPLTSDRPSLRLVVRPTGTNNYTGATVADGAAIIFDTAGSLPAATSIELSNGGYVSVTDNSGLTLADLVSKLSSVTNGGILGFDSSASANFDAGGTPITYADPVNFGGLTQDVYLGSASTGGANVTFSGAITTANGGTGHYYVSGFNNGNFTVSSLLTGAGKVLHVGVPGVFQIANNTFANVAISNVLNDYTGGTILYSGQLQIPAGAALGSGSLTVDADANSDRSASLFLSPSGVFANDIILSSGNLYLAASGNTFTGNISGPGSLDLVYSVTLSGNNSYSGGTTLDDGIQVTAASDTALGTGGLSLLNGATVNFTSAAPVIGSILDGTTYYYDDDGTFEISPYLQIAGAGAATLTINQTLDGYFDGFITEGAGVGSLVKNGSGTLIIEGYVGQDNATPIPYSGGTTINDGRLVAGSTSALGTGAITLNGGELRIAEDVILANAITFGASGGTLGGSGTYSVPITAGTNVTLAPGESPGTMTFTAGLTLAAAGSLEFDVQSASGPAGTGYDLINVSAGLLDITATAGTPFTILLTSLDGSGTPGNVTDFSSATGYSWMLFQGNSGSGITGFNANKFILDASAFTNSLAGGSFSLTQGLNVGNPALFLNFSPVPEPSTYALMALGLAMGLLVRRRRKN